MFGALKGGPLPPPEDRPLNPWAADGPAFPARRPAAAALSRALAAAGPPPQARPRVVYLHPTGAGPAGMGGRMDG
jgi:hypothetical protein